MSTPITIELLHKLKCFNFIHEEIVVDRCKEGLEQCFPHCANHGYEHMRSVETILKEINTFSRESNNLTQYSMWAREAQANCFTSGEQISGEVELDGDTGERQGFIPSGILLGKMGRER